jgi:hypothetical protein
MVSTCAREVRTDIKPRYNFEEGKTVAYDFKVDVNMNVNAMIIQYSGDIKISGKAEMTPVSYVSNLGYRVNFIIRDLNVDGGDARVNAEIIKSVNLLRTWFSTFYITEYGKVTAFHQERPNAQLSSYANAVLPQFDDMEKLWNGYTVSTNYNVRESGRDDRYIAAYSHSRSIRNFDTLNLNVANKIGIDVFERDEYEKAVTPQKMGSAELNLTDIFNYIDGMLVSKTGDLFFYLTLSIRKGIFSYNISVSGRGDIELMLIETPVL